MSEQPDKTKAAWLFEQSQVDYVALSTADNQACANCIFYRATGFDGVDWPHCHIVADYPLPIEPTGWCQRWEVHPEPPGKEPTISEAIEELAEAIESTTGVAMEMSADEKHSLSITPAEPRLTSLRKHLTTPLRPGVQIVKDKAGRRYMFMVTSNGYKDREKEHVATDALKHYVGDCWTGDDTAFIGEQEHFVWHLRELGGMSDLMHADVWSGFLIEIWREKDDPIARSFYTFVERHPEMNWAASHGFYADKHGDTFTQIVKFESSTLPLEAAANLLTLSEVLPMTDKSSKRDEFLNQWFQEEFGIEDAASKLRKGVDELKRELDANGVQAKGLGEGSDALKTARQDALLKAADTLLAVVDVQGEFDTRVAAVEKTVTTEVSTVKQQLADVLAELKAVKKLVNDGPRRAAEDRATVIGTEADVEKAKAQASAVKYDPAFPGMNVPLPDKTGSNGHSQ